MSKRTFLQGAPLRLLFLVVAVALGAGIWVYVDAPGTGAKKKAAKLPPAPVLTAVARTRTVALELAAIGNVQARSTVQVRSRVSGEIVEVAVREGERIKKGDLLFRIDPRPFEAALRQAEANLARDQANLTKAELDLARYQSLTQKGYSSQQRYEEATALKSSLIATIRADRAAIDIARLNLEYTRLLAPIDGRAGSILVHAGNLVQANAADPMLVITETHPVYVAFAVPERDLARIKRRMAEGVLTVDVTIPDEGGLPVTGEIFFINNVVDTTTGTIQLKARFDNRNERLTPGQFVAVKIHLADIDQAVVVPSQAVQSSQKGPFVYVVKGDKTVEMRMIGLGPSAGEHTVVTEGVKAGETVVTDGQLRLYPGRNVQPKPKDGAAKPDRAKDKAPANDKPPAKDKNGAPRIGSSQS